MPPATAGGAHTRRTEPPPAFASPRLLLVLSPPTPAAPSRLRSSTRRLCSSACEGLALTCRRSQTASTRDTRSASSASASTAAVAAAHSPTRPSPPPSSPQWTTRGNASIAPPSATPGLKPVSSIPSALRRSLTRFAPGPLATRAQIGATCRSAIECSCRECASSAEMAACAPAASCTPRRQRGAQTAARHGAGALASASAQSA
mmetsp:Transcript_4258/g.17110  ORF Transcript_4258/g.17110 Transcript_4258/m.17110 type:complete len:204 (-) Transcript_4258:47-658(-)